MNLEQQFKNYIESCRPGDWEHAKRVVEWIEKLGEKRSDLNLLIIAGYIHDIGWYKLVPSGKKLSKEDLLNLQPQASINTKGLAYDALESLNLNLEEKDKILRLINATESYNAKRDDEEIIVDADNLSKTNPDHIKEKYEKSEWLSICSMFEEKLPQRIKTTLGKSLLQKKLIDLRKALEDEINISSNS